MKQFANLLHSAHAVRVKKHVSRHKKKLYIALAVVIAIVVVAQLLYPSSRTLPFARVGGEAAGGKDEAYVALALQNGFGDYALTYQVGDKTSEQSLSDLGAALEADDMLADAVDYPLVYRLIPFSIFWYQTMPSDYVVSWNEEKLTEASKQIAKELSIKAVNASIAIEPSGELKVTPAGEGVAVTAEQITSLTKQTPLPIASAGRDLAVDAETKQPTVRDDDVRTIKQTVESILDSSLVIAIADKATVEPTKSDVAKWISIAKADEGSVKLEADTAAIKSYISGLTREFGTPPTQTVVTLVDGVETRRKPGKTGLGIDAPALTDKLAALVTQPSTSSEQTITAQFASVPSPIKREATYTSSQKGLSAYAADLARDGSIKISVKQLGGKSWSAGGGQWDSVTSASTYKPYLFLRVFDDINDGKLSWNDKIDGVTYEKCLEDSIVISSNSCPMALIEKYDKFKLTSYLRSKGFSAGTGFTFKEVTQATAGDLTKLMAGLEQSTLAKKDNRERLLSAMGQQIYRQGIPAGTSAPVYNKVGFLWDYLNDAAIVRHPEGTYVLAIMTKGHTWGKIAEITREVERIMYG